MPHDPKALPELWSQRDCPAQCPSHNETAEDQLRREFEHFGKVKSARIISNRFNRKSKGFGFVEMPNRPEAEAAIKALHDKEIQGRKLRVNEARNKTP
ncbi:MAG: RNA recognition motif [Firmicutes bacterium ADurb.Bin506]|nr:MAG: RNA recognition motif [Firmicutes bacterium ADurb.Bin506]